MTINKRLLVLMLVICFFFNATAVLAVSSYTDNTIGVRTILFEKEKEAVEREKERLKKKFSNIKEQMQGTKVYESFVAKKQIFFNFSEGLTRFFDGVREMLEEQWGRNFTNL